MKNKIISLAISIALTASVSANDELIDIEGDDYFSDFYGNEEMVEIATGTKKQFHLLPSVASVITAQDISDMGAIYLSDVLEKVPGLHVMPSSQGRTTPIFSVRGINTAANPQLLVLMNGTEFKHPTSGGLTYNFRYSLHNVERIEVIRGPGSAVYGADAYSGVINIITKKTGTESSVNAGLTAGSFSTSELWANINWTEETFRASLSLSKYQTDGDDGRIVNSDLQTTFDGLFGTSASLAPSFLASQLDITDIHLDVAVGNWSLESWYWGLENGGSSVGAVQTLDYVGEENADSYLTKLSYHNDYGNHWNIDANVSYYTIEADSFLVLFPAGATLPVGDDGNLFTPNLPDVEGGGLVSFTDGAIGDPIPSLDETRVNLISTYDGIERHVLRLGAGWIESKLSVKEFKNFGPGILDGNNFSSVVNGNLFDVTNSENIYVKDQSRTVKYISLQDEWQISNDFTLTAGFRYDDYSDFGDTINPRVALVWQTRHNVTTKLLYGSAFRAPSFIELSAINNPAALGNSSLNPEEIDTYEFVIDYRITTDSKLVVNFFDYKATDLIVRIADAEPATTKTYQNASNQNGNGVEVEFNWQVSNDISWDSSFSYQQVEDTSTGAKIADIPTKQFYTDLRIKLSDNLKITSQLNYVMDRKRAVGDTRAKLDDFTLVNLTAIYQVNNHLKIRLAAKNIFDKDYYEGTDGRIADDLPMEGRSVYGMLDYTF
ncbi:MAG: TonB-dependent receptor [Colwellia sp.]|nr:TonB-dependent receptor [Colwellia sp.]